MNELMIEQDDEQLVEKAKENPAFFGALYTKYVKSVYLYIWQRAGRSKAVAEELAQETFLKAFKHLPAFKSASVSYLAYLRKIAKNLVITYYRKKKTISLEEIPEVPVEAVAPIEESVETGGIWNVIKKLNPISQKILTLKYKEGMRIRDIALITKRSQNAVKIILSRSRALVAKTMNISRKTKRDEKPFE